MGGRGSGRRKSLDGVPRRRISLESEPDVVPVEPFTQSNVSAPAETPVLAVEQPLGSRLEVLSEAEQQFYEGLRGSYETEFQFSSATDRADLERLLVFELLGHRWSTCLLTDRDVDGRVLAPVLADAYRRNLADNAKSIAAIKDSLGMSRAKRTQELDSVANYVQLLLSRAKEFGVHRTKQVDEALVLMNEIKSNVETFYRSNEAERKRTFKDEAAIVEWIRSDVIPRFVAVDDAWRGGTQKYWSPM